MATAKVFLMPYALVMKLILFLIFCAPHCFILTEASPSFDDQIAAYLSKITASIGTLTNEKVAARCSKLQQRSSDHTLRRASKERKEKDNPAGLVSLERVAWTMAATAGRKHAEVFYSTSFKSPPLLAEHSTQSSSSSSVPAVERKPHRYGVFYPLSYLHNSFVNTGYTVFEALWHFVNVAKPHLIREGFISKKSKEGAAAATHNTSADLVSVTSALSCLLLGSDNSGEGAAACPSPPEHFSGRFPESTQTAALWELSKEVASFAFRSCSHVASSTSSAPLMSCAVGKASEMLYWSMRADDYAVGRGRVVQSSVLLDVLQEEVGGEEAPYWYAAVPSAVGLGSNPTSVYRYAHSRRRPHPQFVAYRGEGHDGHGALVREIPFNYQAPPHSSDVLSRKRHFHILNPLGVGKPHVPLPPNSFSIFHTNLAFPVNVFVFSLSVRADLISKAILSEMDNTRNTNNDKKSGDTVPIVATRPTFDPSLTPPNPFKEVESNIAAPLSEWRKKGADISKPPEGSDLRSGESFLFGFFKSYWAALHRASQHYPATESDGRPIVDPEEEELQGPFHCAPVVMTMPKYAVSVGKEGTEVSNGYLSPSDNRAQQVPIDLEPSWRIAVHNDEVIADEIDLGNNKELIDTPDKLIARARTWRRKVFVGLAKSKALFSKSIRPRSTLAVTLSNDGPIYAPYMDPRSPAYRRILCATYTYHKKNDRATVFHGTGGRHCDKHLLFTDRAMPPEMLSRLDQGRFVVVALNTPGGEDYMNMWQKTRMILDKLELLVRGYEERTPEEGANDPQAATRRADDVGPTSPRRSPSIGAETAAADSGPPQLVASSGDAGLDVQAVAEALLPHYSGYDYVLLSGDDVCLNALKLRRYLAEVDEVYGVAMPAASSSSCAAHYRSATTPHHIGYSHRTFVSGAAYLMNRQGYGNHMASGHDSCFPQMRTFAEDVMMGRCHNKAGLIHRHTASFGPLEDVFNAVGIEAVTGTTHSVKGTWWLNEYRRKVWPRGAAITSKDSIVHHFCPVEEMHRGESMAFGAGP